MIEFSAPEVSKEIITYIHSTIPGQYNTTGGKE